MAKLSTTSVFGDLLVDGMIHGNVTGNLTGNASTATSATTATSAGKWSTARTLTIGNTGKSVDGSGNQSWTLSEIGAYPVTGGTLSGPITGETRVVGGSLTYSDPWTGTACALKVTGKIACTDTIKAPTFDGNATTATKLATVRTLTVGNTGKTFDGSGNVSWTLAEIGAAASSHSHTSINYQDTRSVNTAAKDVPNGLSIHLKSNGSDGISDGGSYHPVLMMKPWGDKSGWPIGQLAVTQNNNLYFRVSSGADDSAWNAWKKVSLDGHTHSAGGTVTAVNSNLSSVTINSYDSILSGINTNIGKL